MNYTIEDLKHLMARLRDPKTGCPWDTRQTFRTIVPHTLEEAHEVADAIEREDYPHLKEELGDLLFQVIFYSQLGREQELFHFDSIVDTLVRKLLRRHPHVFPDGTLESRVDPDKRPDEEWIAASWERIKDQERVEKQERTQTQEYGEEDGPRADASRLKDIPASLPAMTRAGKLQRRAARVGFDWPHIGPVFDKLEEEIAELKEAWQNAQQDPAARDEVEDELGDLMFVCVNLARFLKVDPDQALRRTNRKFEARFRAIERILEEQGKTLEDESLEALDQIWASVKGVERH